MKIAKKDNKAPNSDSSKLFFNTGGEGSFFSQTEKPFIASYPISPKFTIGKSDDKYEREADTMADHVVGMDLTTNKEAEESNIQKINVKNKDLHTAKPIAMKASGENSPASPDFGTQLNNSKGNGQALSKDLNAFMSNAFKADFSNVNIHTNSDSVQMNQSLNSRAFTNGSDIYFNKGEYNPETKEGKHLLAHELTHVVQQKSATKQLPHAQKIQRQTNQDEVENSADGSKNPMANGITATKIVVRQGPVTPISKPLSSVGESMDLLGEGIQRKENGVPDIQRADPATVGAAAAVTAITYQVLKDLVSIEKGDITYTFDRMRGQKYPNNNKNWEKMTNWRSTHWDIFLIHYSPILNEWLVGMEVRLNWEYNGYGLSGIYFTKRDFWDKPFWGGEFTWIIQPLMSTRKDVNGHPVAKVKIVVDANFTQTIGSDIPESKAWIIDGEGGGSLV